MMKSDSCWINRRVCGVFITFIYAVTITGVHSQNMDRPQGLLIQNGKEPPDIHHLEPDVQNTVPDIQNTVPGQQTIPNFRNGNSTRREFPLNQRPMQFLCSRRVPMFVSRGNISEQTTDSPFSVSVSPVEGGHSLQGVYIM